VTALPYCQLLHSNAFISLFLKCLAKAESKFTIYFGTFKIVLYIFGFFCCHLGLRLSKNSRPLTADKATDHSHYRWEYSAICRCYVLSLVLSLFLSLCVWVILAAFIFLHWRETVKSAGLVLCPGICWRCSSHFYSCLLCVAWHFLCCLINTLCLQLNHQQVFIVASCYCCLCFVLCA